MPGLDSPSFIDDLVEILAWAHHRFLWIHPFTDYNGRIARLLINIILLRIDLPPIELKAETPSGREKYIKALQKADEGDHTDLRKLILSAIKEAVKELQ